MAYRSGGLRAALSTTASLAILAAAGGVSAQEQAEEDAAAVEEVVVTGVRRSLEDALATKRASTEIIDSISAEGIGKLPDLNLAESLTRVPGVQINRSATRRQGTVSLRGLPGGFAQTTINGQYLASPDVSNFAYGTVRSEVFSGIDVIKAQSASDMTGGLSGTVNLRTGDPMAAKNSFTLSLDGAYEELTEEWAPGGALAFSRQIIPGVLAVRGAVGIKRSDFRIDDVQINGYDVVAGSGNASVADDVYAPRQVRLRTQQTESESLSGSFGIEWRPVDGLKAQLFGFYSDHDSDAYQTEFLFENRAGATRTNLGPVTSEGEFGSTWRRIRIDDPTLFVDSRLAVEEFRTLAITPKLEWSDDNWRVTGTAHFTEAVRDAQFIGFQAVQTTLAGAASNGYSVEFDTGAGDLGQVSYDLSPALGNLVNLEQAWGPLVGPLFRETRAVNTPGASFFNGFRPERERDREWSLALDVVRELDFGPLKRVSVGGVYRDKAQSQDQSLLTLLGVDLTKLDNSFYNRSVFSEGAEFMGGGVARFDLADYGELDPRALAAALTPVNASAVPANPGELIFFVGPSGFIHVIDSGARAATYDNEQKITGGYVEVDLDQELTSFARLRGNLGVRYEKSERSTEAARRPGTIDFEYENTLPYANVILDLRDDLVLRASYTETLRRPQVDSFAVLRSVVVDGTGSLVTANLGAADLKPFISNNWDFAFEYYNRRGSSFTATAFNKEIVDYAGSVRICPADGGGFGFGPFVAGPNNTCFTAQATPATASTPAVRQNASVAINVTSNQDTFTLKGFELSAQQNLDFLPAPWNGFGGQVNYTNVDFSTKGTFRLGEISEHTFNAILYYEVPRFAVRAAYNWRSEYFLAAGGTQGGGDRIVDARPQLDLSGSFNVNDRLQLTAEAFNVTDEDLYEYEGQRTRARSYFHYGRTFIVGLRYRFQ